MTIPAAARAWARLAWVYVLVRLAAVAAVFVALVQVAQVAGWLRWE